MGSNTKLTSVVYSDIINSITFNRYSVVLNKTQMQKLLYICYGFYLAQTNEKLFEDDSPKAWPFGPVFPKVNRHFVPGVINNITKDAIEELKKNKKALNIIDVVTKEFHKVSAIKLSEWSHNKDGPWYKTVYGNGGENAKWNTEISDDSIVSYFKRYKLPDQAPKNE